MLAAGIVHEEADLLVDLKSGLMRGIRQIASPNCDFRPAGVEADLIVVHGISLPAIHQRAAARRASLLCGGR